MKNNQKKPKKKTNKQTNNKAYKKKTPLDMCINEKFQDNGKKK
jgi:hypothetical protein